MLTQVSHREEGERAAATMAQTVRIARRAAQGEDGELVRDYARIASGLQACPADVC